LLPAHFGLVSWSRRVTELLQEHPAFVVDEVEWNGFQCVRILYEMGRELGDDPVDSPLPSLLWLSKGHGYFPVRMVYLRRSDRGPGPYDDPERFSFEYGGRPYGARGDLIVDELHAVGAGWLPVRARQRALNKREPGTITYVVKRDTLRLGKVPRELYALKEVERAAVRDNPCAAPYFIGGDLTKVQSADADATSQAPPGSTNQPQERLDPERGVAWIYLTVGAAGLCVGWILMRRRDR